MNDTKLSADRGWLDRKIPHKLRARALKSVFSISSPVAREIDRRFMARWNSSCDAQIALLYAVFWRRERDCSTSRRTVVLMFKQLRECDPPFKLNTVRGLKEKHVRALLLRWEREGISPATVLRRIQDLREFTEWFEKRHVVDRALKAHRERRPRVTEGRTPELGSKTAAIRPPCDQFQPQDSLQMTLWEEQ